MALKINIGKHAVMAAAIAATCAALIPANSSQAGGEMSPGNVIGAATMAGKILDAATTNKFTVPTFDPAKALLMPVPRLQLASLMPLPGQRLKWPPRRFSKQTLFDLSLAALRRGEAALPPVYLSQFPDNLADLRDSKQRKDIFIKTVLPLVLRANDEVRTTRQRMLSLIRREQEQGNLSANERAFLNQLAAQYEVTNGDFYELQKRVDVIPASLALAQGAEESGWGTSRFARQGNAVFGQRTFRKGGGLVPSRREAGQSYEVKAFSNLYTSVRSYIFNLNIHTAYKSFRQKRANFRGGGQPLDSHVLIGALTSYSERGQKYIDTIRVIIRANRLDDFDDVRLLSDNGRNKPS
jgi:Bax protein